MKNQKEPPGELRQSNLRDVLGEFKFELPFEITQRELNIPVLKYFFTGGEFHPDYRIYTPMLNSQERLEDWVHKAHLVAPLGSWKRIRPGKKLSEQEIHVITAKMFQNFAIIIRISCFSNLLPLQIFFSRTKSNPQVSFVKSIFRSFMVNPNWKYHLRLPDL